MRILYSLALSAALLLGGLRAQAQTQPAGPKFALGTSQALVQELETQVAARTARTGPPTVRLRVAPNQSFTGQVNYRQDLGAAGEYLVGELPGVAGSSFQLRVEGKQVEGTIILRGSKQAYRYSADAQGNAVVQEVDINKVICIDYNKPVGYREPASVGRNAAGSSATALAAPISLQSFPGARGCILLDVDGYALPAGTGWNNGNAYNAPSANMTDANVQALWELVSEDYRPFSLNVTTDENVFNTYPKNMRMRCIISPGSGSTIASGAGGVAFLTSFKTNDDTPCWVFMADPKSGGEAASHEVGHTLGLSHDGRLNPKEEYTTNSGNATTQWAPIMGAGYYKPVTQWSKGEYNSASQTQDDLAIMSGATYNVGYRNDDYGNSPGAAAALARSGNSLSANGLIERTTDQDYFSFTTGGGSVSFNVNKVGRYGDLDLVVRLFEGSGNQIGTFDTSGGGNLNVAFTAQLSAGTYYLQVDGTGSGDPTTDGYSDYASLGTYSISGTAPAGGGTTPGVATVYRDCSYGSTAVSLPVGDYTLTQLQARGIYNDDISSLQVTSGYQVVLYENDNFSGNGVVISANYACLVNAAVAGGTWNDRTSSLKVQAAAPATFSQQLEAEAASVNKGMIAETCAEGGQDMGYIDAGDYLVWNGINLPNTGTYLIEYRVASGASGGTISADLNAGAVQLGNTSIAGTGGWQNWQTVSKTVTISAGTYNFGASAQTGGYNLNWVRITYQGAAAASLAQTSPTPAAGIAAAPAATASALAEATLELYPNPVADRLHLQAGQDLAGSSFRIVDALGRPALSGSAAAGSVDVSGLKTGVYTLVLTAAGQAPVTRRFVTSG